MHAAGLPTTTTRYGGRRESARRLAAGGWLECYEILARPLRPLNAPLFGWVHGEAPPDFYGLSSLLHRRAACVPVVTTVVRASAKARWLFGVGGNGVRIKLTQATHDLQVAEIYLRYAEQGLPKSKHWVHEDFLPGSWRLRQRPDAVVTDSDGEIVRAIEYGGDYSARRLFEFHRALSNLAIPYEIW